MDVPLDRVGDPLGLLTVHAHPDDEASKGSGAVARYSDEGVNTVLVCCTGGEAGDILNPAVDTPEVRENLYEVRMRELQNAADAIGYRSVHLLGYRDSGMPESEENSRPDNFANAPLDEAVGRLVRIIRAERPQVIITYAEDRSWYPHPDHIRVHEISLPAFDAAGDPEQFPDAGPVWEPSKLYYTGFSRRRIELVHEEFIRRGEESPYASWFERGMPEFSTRYTTFIDVGDWLPRRRAGLLAHRTQVDPNGHWMRLPDDVMRKVFPWEEFLLAQSRVDTGVADGDTEDDLFAGVRAEVLEPRVGSAAVKYLTQEWLDETRALAAEQPEHPGATARIQYVITAGPDGDVKYSWVLEDGKLLESHLGSIAEPEVTITVPYAEWIKTSRGELDPSAAFMQGIMKVSGDMGKFLQLLPITQSREYLELQARIRAITEY